MILDYLQNWKSYNFGPSGKTAFNFLFSLTPEIEDGEYPIRGNKIFARVMTCKTHRRETAVPEAHRKYADIQIVLSGIEAAERFPGEELTIKTAYDKAKDALFFRRPDTPGTRLELKPGVFAVFFPQDAHMTSLTTAGASKPVKKVVLKIDVEIL